MNVDWKPLKTAISQRLRQGDTPTFWWRDDDATQPSAPLDALQKLAAKTGVCVHLAVIPAHAKPALATYVAERGQMVPLVHGWAHADTSEIGQKKSEFQSVRQGALEETGNGLRRLEALFSSALVPMFVPPWNRISDEIRGGLAGQGYRALSTFGARKIAEQSGLQIINTHVDPIFWRGNRGLADPEQLIQTATQHIASGTSEPLGLLTHHLVHTRQIWDFSAQFLEVMQEAGAVPADIGKLVNEADGGFTGR